MLTRKEKAQLMDKPAIGFIPLPKGARIEVLKMPVYEVDFMGLVLNKPKITLRANGKVFESPLRENERFYCNGKYYDLGMVKGVEA